MSFKQIRQKLFWSDYECMQCMNARYANLYLFYNISAVGEKVSIHKNKIQGALAYSEVGHISLN